MIVTVMGSTELTGIAFFFLSIKPNTQIARTSGNEPVLTVTKLTFTVRSHTSTLNRLDLFRELLNFPSRISAEPLDSYKQRYRSRFKS